MKNFKKIFLAMFAFIIILLASCGSSNKIGIKESDVEFQYTVARTSVKITVYFDKYETIEAGKSKPLIRCYSVADDNTETWKSEQALSFSNSIYSKSKEVEFTSLEADKQYKFYLYITYNNKDYKIASELIRTKADGGSKEDSTLISNVEEFKAMEDDSTGFYQLTEDIDFSNESLSLFTSNAFEGELDGGIYDDNGELIGCHTLSNFKLGSTKLAGLFGYTSNATIKNLIIDTVSDDYSSSNSEVYHGALIGKAVRTTVSNVNVNSVSFVYSNGSSAQHATGGLIGLADTVNISDVIMTDVSLKFTSLRIQAAVGLFIGRLVGNTLDSTTVITNSSVTGNLDINLNYIKSTSTTVCYATIGGFIGDLGTQGLIQNCYSNNEIEIYQESANERDFTLYVGGFVGSNRAGSMNIKDSATVTNMNLYAGVKDDEADYSETLLATVEGYVGGFIGKAIPTFKGINNCYVLFNDKVYSLNCDTTSTYEDDNEVERNRLYDGLFYGYVDSDNESKISDCHTTVEEGVIYDLDQFVLDGIADYENLTVVEHKIYVVGGTSSVLKATPGTTVTITYEENDIETFVGWVVEEGDVTVADSTQKETTFVMDNYDVTISADCITKSYTVIYDVDGGSIELDPEELLYGIEITILDYEGTKENYEFGGYILIVDGEESELEDNTIPEDFYKTLIEKEVASITIKVNWIAVQ